MYENVCGGKVFGKYEVDFSKLSRIAASMVNKISTTYNNDDRSLVVIQCKYTNEELDKHILADTTGRYSEGEKYGAQERMSTALYKKWGIEDEVQKHPYIWDAKRKGESPEEYFERHAEYIRKEAFPYLEEGELKDFLSDEEYENLIKD